MNATSPATRWADRPVAHPLPHPAGAAKLPHSPGSGVLSSPIGEKTVIALVDHPADSNPGGGP